MRLSDDYETDEVKTGISMGAMMICVLTFLAVVVVAVLLMNKPKGGTNGEKDPFLDDKYTQNISDNQVVIEDEEYPLGESTLVSDDLDFWNMYKEDKELDKDLDHTAEEYAKRLEALEEESKEEDLSENGTKTEVILPDGTSQWVMINALIKKNSYDYTNLVYEEPFMRYYVEGKKISRQGIKLDEDYGVISFDRVKDAGIDYCIIEMGSRGYATGALTLDDFYAQYLNDANMAGLGVGVSFYSQAATPEEAVEEANLVLQNLQQSDIKLDYPIVFEMQLINNDTSRIENLTKGELTAIAKAFCATIKQGGYTPAIYGSKYWLLRKLDLTQLSDYNIWLSQEGDIPDYPYQFSMWEYKPDAELEGILGKVPISISFVDYEKR